jgi:hypothetical protein
MHLTYCNNKVSLTKKYKKILVLGDKPHDETVLLLWISADNSPESLAEFGAAENGEWSCRGIAPVSEVAEVGQVIAVFKLMKPTFIRNSVGLCPSRRVFRIQLIRLTSSNCMPLYIPLCSVGGGYRVMDDGDERRWAEVRRLMTKAPVKVKAWRLTRSLII